MPRKVVDDILLKTVLVVLWRELESVLFLLVEA